MFHVLLKGFIMLTLMIIFLINASCDTVHSSAIHSWSEEPWTWGGFLEEQYYETLKFFEDFEFEQNTLQNIRKKRNVGGSRSRAKLFVEGVESDSLNDEINSPACLFDFLGQKWVLILDNVFRVHQHEGNRIFVEFSNLLDNLEYIYDVQTLTFNNSTFAILIYKHHVEILKMSLEINSTRSAEKAMGSKVNDLKLSRKYFKQKISKDGLDISRGKIFSQNGVLYLVVLFSHQGAKSYSYLYRWSGSHFDEIEKILTVSPTDVAVVSLEDGFGIVITQNSKNRNSWQLFKMSSKGQKLRRAYSIPAQNGLIMALTYKDQELLALNEDPHSTYLLLISSAGSSQIYTISGNGVVKATKSKLYLGNVTSGKVLTLDQGTFIFISTKHQVSVYRPSGDSLESILTTSIGRDKNIQTIDVMKLEEDLIGVNIIVKETRNVNHVILKIRVTENILVTESETSYMEKCFADIEYLLNEKHSEIEDLKRQMESLRKIDDTVTISTLVNIEDSKITEIHFPETPSLNTTTENLLALAEETRKSLEAMEDLAAYLFVEDELVNINNSMVINGDLIVDNLVAAHVEAETVNSLPFEDSEFFIHKDGIKLPEEMFLGRFIRAHRLNAPIFGNILQNANIFRSLSTDNIFTVPGRTINGVDPLKMVTKTHSGIIKGAKMFNSLTTENIHTERFGKEFLTPWVMEAIQKETSTNYLHVTNDVSTVNLQVKKINGVAMEEFMNSVLLKRSNVYIKGNLYFKSDLTVQNLKSETLRGIPVDKFFTKTTPQTISSQMAIKSVLVTDLKADRINGVDFTNNVAVKGRHNVVKAPTTIFNLDVTEDLILNCGSAEESLCNIIATKPEDLLQIYNGPVTIIGSLTVNDLKFGNDAKAFINDEEFSTEIERIFWVKNKNQVIPNDVTFSQGLTTPQLQVQRINNQPVDSILSFDNLTNVEYVIFQNVSVKNDLISSGYGDCFRVNYLNQTVVKRFGRNFIKGRKTFSNKLITKSLTTDFINEKNMLAAIGGEFKNARFTGEVHFERVKVTGTLQVYTDIGVDVMNGFKWTDFIKDSGKINQPTYINSAVFKGLLQANQIVTPNTPLFGATAELPNFSEVDVIVKGSAEINTVYGNQFVNDIDVLAYSKKVVRKNQPSIVRGIKTFKKDVVVSEEFESEILNGLPFRILMTESLTKGDDQVIKGNLIVDDDLHADHLTANSLNGIPSQEFINTQEKTIVINSDLDVDGNLKVQNNLVYRKADGCDPAKPQNVPQNNWNYLKGNVDEEWKNNKDFSDKTETTKNKPVFFTGELNENGISHLNGLEENEANQAENIDPMIIPYNTHENFQRFKEGKIDTEHTIYQNT